MVEAFADSIRLPALGLGARVIDILDSQAEFIFVPLGVAAILRAAVGQHPTEPDLVLIEERHETRSLSRSAAVIGVLRS